MNAQKRVSSNWSNYFELEYKVTSLKNPTIKELGMYLNSENLTQVNNAIHYLMFQKDKKHLAMLAGLLRIPNVSVQKTAICICGALSELELINTLVEFLDSQQLFPSALCSLLKMGEKGVKPLVQMFYKTDITLLAQLAIIEVVGKYHTPESIGFLLENISNHRKEIYEKAISCLKELKYQPSERDLPKMFHPITEASQTVAWDISALASLGTVYDNHPLKKAIHCEFLHHQKVLIDLLSITYNANSVKHVQDYLSSETAEGISYGLELFDLFLSEEIKPMILTVFEDLPLVEKTHLFEDFFPVEITSPKELLLNIINRDPNLICIETKRTALIEYTILFNEITNDIIAQLFNPVLELQQAAIISINQLQPAKIKQLKSRLTADIKLNIAQIENTLENSKSLFSIADLLSEQLKIENHMFTRLSECFEIKTSVNPHFFNNNEQLSNYFVFLITSQLGATEIINVNMYIENNFKSVNFENGEIQFFIGINKNKMNQLALTHTKNIESIINTII